MQKSVERTWNGYTNDTLVKQPELSRADVSSRARYHWDRCGPLSPQCERFFVQEACFYECEPAAGLFRRYPTTLLHDRDGHIESPSR